MLFSFAAAKQMADNVEKADWQADEEKPSSCDGHIEMHWKCFVSDVIL